MTVINLLDDRTRPIAPPIEGVTPAQRAAGKRLGMYHRMHLAALNETKDMMEQVEAGEIEAATLAAKIDSMELMSNYRAFGSLCGRECMFLNFHHTHEDREIFPVLHAEGSDGLKRVVERLMAEHEIVHALLEELAVNVEAIGQSPGPESFAQAKATFATLYRVVLSHFGYEEESIEDALGYYNLAP